MGWPASPASLTEVEKEHVLSPLTLLRINSGERVANGLAMPTVTIPNRSQIEI